MNSNFSIIKRYLSKLDFYSPNVSSTLFAKDSNTVLNVYMDVEYRLVGDKDDLFQVDLMVNQICTKEENCPIFKLELVYSALVSLDEKQDKEVIHNIMKVEVPQILYDNVRKIVADVTAESGYSVLVMKDHTFSLQEDDVDYESVGYNQLVEDCMQRDGYKYYYSFITPIKYAHPDYEEFSETFWNVFFQMLMGDLAVRCVIRDSRDSLPELVFSMENYINQNVADLSVEEVKSVALRLMHRPENLISCIDAFARQNLDEDFAETISADGLISRSDFFELYGCCDDDEEDSVDDDTTEASDGNDANGCEANISSESILNSLYCRILDCDMMTLPYRL